MVHQLVKPTWTEENPCLTLLYQAAKQRKYEENLNEIGSKSSNVSMKKI